MTDEEMAEEYLKDKLEERKDKFIFELPEVYITDVKQAFLAGLKAGRPQWHDLRKDPNDLPKDNDEKLCFYGKGKVVARYDSEYGCWDTYFNNLGTVIPSSVIIAWCEIPTFDKESE